MKYEGSLQGFYRSLNWFHSSVRYLVPLKRVNSSLKLYYAELTIRCPCIWQRLTLGIHDSVLLFFMLPIRCGRGYIDHLDLSLPIHLLERVHSTFLLHSIRYATAIPLIRFILWWTRLYVLVPAVSSITVGCLQSERGV
jgi:hypothetical protein